MLAHFSLARPGRVLVCGWWRITFFGSDFEDDELAALLDGLLQLLGIFDVLAVGLEDDVARAEEVLPVDDAVDQDPGHHDPALFQADRQSLENGRERKKML